MAIKTEREITINRILPKKFIDIDSDNRNIENLVGKSLFMHGLSGVGKSVLMATLVKRYIRDGKRVDWIQYPRFIMKLQGMFGDYRPEYSDQGYKIEKRNPYEWAIEIGEYDGILAIDDLGVEKASEFVRQITYSIINEREVNQRQTLITSNYGLRDIDRMIDSRISSRIAGMCEIVELKGKDRRLSK